MTTERKILAEALRVQAEDHEKRAKQLRLEACDAAAIQLEAKARTLIRAAEILDVDVEPLRTEAEAWLRELPSMGKQEALESLLIFAGHAKVEGMLERDKALARAREGRHFKPFYDDGLEDPEPIL